MGTTRLASLVHNGKTFCCFSLFFLPLAATERPCKCAIYKFANLHIYKFLFYALQDMVNLCKRILHRVVAVDGKIVVVV